MAISDDDSLEDDPTKDLPEPKAPDTQPDLPKMIEEYFGVRDQLMIAFEEVRTEMAGLRAEVKKLNLKMGAFGTRQSHFEEDLTEVKERLTQLEEPRQ